MIDVIVVGGGPAGMAAALECSSQGYETLLVERNPFLGGILMQCIHNGFGLNYFKKELTGPEYAYEFAKKVENSNVKVKLNSFVKEINGTKVEIISENGDEIIEAKAVILATGCRERPAGAIMLKGARPAGVLTAGQAQRMVNIQGKLPGKNIVILGSGDIGLIMARRLTLEGANVKMVLEVMSESSGLQRNIQQCLNDFNIPLYLNTTVAEVVGEDKIQGVYVAEVDENRRPIESTKRFVECDTLVLSVGLIPEVEVLTGVEVNRKTSGAVVDDYYQTNVKGVFTCGNVLHVHDIADMVSKEAERTAKSVCEYLKENYVKEEKIHNIKCGDGVRYTVPATYHKGNENLTVLFRSSKKFVKNYIVVKNNDEIIAKKFCMAIIPSEMQEITFSKENLRGDIEICVTEKV